MTAAAASRTAGSKWGDFKSVGVTLHDFDGDGHIDALVSNMYWAETFYNSGHGTFAKGQFAEMPSRDGYHIGVWRFQLVDLNGDGTEDLFVAGCCGGGLPGGEGGHWQTLNACNTVWLGRGEGRVDTGQAFGSGSTSAVALGDLDGDGDIDAFGANNFYLDPVGDLVSDANSVWFNDGQGNFSDSGQRLGRQRRLAVALGDLDGNGNLDALVGNAGSDEIWLNNGEGVFGDSGQALGNSDSSFVYLVDFDGDGDLDALLAGKQQATIWWNDGKGKFRDSGQRLSYWGRYAVAVGDVDGDGAVDVVAGRLDRALVWLNDGAGKMRRP